MPELDHRSGARLGGDGRYRYLLWRTWDDSKPRVLYVMLNPSTADAVRDDPTVRRCAGFASRHGCGSLAVANLFALRATDPRALPEQWCHGNDVVGPENDGAIVRAAEVVDIIVLAWGSRGGLMGRDRAVLELLAGSPLFCLGTTAGGQPRHPLYLPGATPLEPYQAR